MFKYRVHYNVLTEDRTATSGAVGSTNMSNLTMVVSAHSASAAEQMVQSMHGGWKRCQILSAVMLHE